MVSSKCVSADLNRETEVLVLNVFLLALKDTTVSLLLQNDDLLNDQLKELLRVSSSKHRI